MNAADAMAIAELAVARALEPEIATPDDMRAAVRALAEAFAAVGDAHRTIIAEARALGADEQTDKAEADQMLETITAMWSAQFGGGDTDVVPEAPALFSTSWDVPEPEELTPELAALDARARAILEAWSTRTGAWADLAELERRSLASIDRLRAHQRALSAQFAAARAASVAVPVLQQLRDELVELLRKVAEDPAGVPRPVLSNALRRAGAGLVEATKLVEHHGAIPGLAETADALVKVFTLLGDGFQTARGAH